MDHEVIRSGARRYTFALGAIGIATVVSLGCASTKVAPTPDAGFIEHPERMSSQPERFPFDAVWVSEGLKDREFKNVLVRRVDVDHRVGIDWTKEQPDTKQSFKVQSEINRLAKVSWEAMRNAFYYDPNRALAVVDDERPDTVIIEMSIIRVVMGGWGGDGTVAIEARIRDGDSNQVVATFKDQESGNRTKIVENWALELVELVNTPSDYKVNRR